MRGIVFGFFATVFATTSLAQEAPQSFGPFRVGASPSEVSQNGAALSLQPALRGRRSSSTQFRAYGLDWQGWAIFDWALGVTGFNVRHSEQADNTQCLAHFQNLVTGLEGSFGALDGEPTGLELQLGEVSARALGGSNLRRYRSVTGGFEINNVFAPRNETDVTPYHVEAQGAFGSAVGERCTLSVRVSTRAPPSVPDPMIAELADVPAILGTPDWLEQPTDDDVRRAYPLRARDRNMEGEALLACRVRDEGGALRCMIESETPSGWGFGDAALSAAAHYRIAPTTNGVSTAGKRVTVQIHFGL